METKMKELLPNVQDLLALQPEELAGCVLQHLNSMPKNSQDTQVSLHNYLLSSAVRDYPHDQHEKVERALSEAWNWLEREGMLVRRGDPQWFYISRRGQLVLKPDDLKAYRNGNLLPRQLLHARIAQKVWATFLRGDYDTAVFQAFKEVEVAVREACLYAADVVSVDLMRRAFNADSGPLRDTSAPRAEQESLSHLFAGAAGYFRNPTAHRDIVVSDPAEAVEMIIFASHLLRIVDARVTKMPP